VIGDGEIGLGVARAVAIGGIAMAFACGCQRGHRNERPVTLADGIAFRVPTYASPVGDAKAEERAFSLGEGVVLTVVAEAMPEGCRDRLETAEKATRDAASAEDSWIAIESLDRRPVSGHPALHLVARSRAGEEAGGEPRPTEMFGLCVGDRFVVLELVADRELFAAASADLRRAAESVTPGP
jgi:hypothetical protein